ncbi:uncharacterized protein MKK02DRAFT_31903 [Dioszegia hungarica]|uniref:Uncharacterized protein n=1 Tax=Dioszegia hungarica TaxID=4972 RepID=A0AA38HDY1_9TREE|nr:uncharacterized protein MKK02DRAFT_31903 [Dioszegia hungarica]KAI9638465.1 hypothetical protein MKK02DRAFT_31903 [Dioszegia hungarica]
MSLLPLFLLLALSGLVSETMGQASTWIFRIDSVQSYETGSNVGANLVIGTIALPQHQYTAGVFGGIANQATIPNSRGIGNHETRPSYPDNVSFVIVVYNAVGNPRAANDTLWKLVEAAPSTIPNPTNDEHAVLSYDASSFAKEMGPTLTGTCDQLVLSKQIIIPAAFALNSRTVTSYPGVILADSSQYPGAKCPGWTYIIRYTVSRSVAYTPTSVQHIGGYCLSRAAASNTFCSSKLPAPWPRLPGFSLNLHQTLLQGRQTLRIEFQNFTINSLANKFGDWTWAGTDFLRFWMTATSRTKDGYEVLSLENRYGLASLTGCGRPFARNGSQGFYMDVTWNVSEPLGISLTGVTSRNSSIDTLGSAIIDAGAAYAAAWTNASLSGSFNSSSGDQFALSAGLNGITGNKIEQALNAVRSLAGDCNGVVYRFAYTIPPYILQRLGDGGYFPISTRYSENFPGLRCGVSDYQAFARVSLTSFKSSTRRSLLPAWAQRWTPTSPVQNVQRRPLPLPGPLHRRADSFTLTTGSVIGSVASQAASSGVPAGASLQAPQANATVLPGVASLPAICGADKSSAQSGVSVQNAALTAVFALCSSLLVIL